VIEILEWSRHAPVPPPTLGSGAKPERGC
jgi:hypothetical protein